MNYKIYDEYDEYLKKIDELLENKYVIFPIILLFKLLLLASSNANHSSIIKNNIEDYKQLKKYKKFFTDELLNVYELIFLVFEADISDGYWLKNYNNGMAYYILASRSYYNKKYIESIFFATKCKEFLSAEGNIIRTLFLNNTLMSSLLYVGNYEECNDLAFKQNLSLKAINSQYTFLNKYAIKYYIASLLGLNKYSEIISKLENKPSYNITLLTCYLVAVFKVKGINEYYKAFNEINVENLDEKYKQYLNLLNTVITKNKKSLLQQLAEYRMDDWIINILKKIEMKTI